MTPYTRTYVLGGMYYYICVGVCVRCPLRSYACAFTFACDIYLVQYNPQRIQGRHLTTVGIFQFCRLACVVCDLEMRAELFLGFQKMKMK